ncbi:hypothetical protein GGTG_11343 [Gaeumannomyces tritici R3-111a-1]|uniref:Uncharacterized protein n=1 Tax=Gaeumannomyces tritici (strain R3-111a-1) TaxID=644352 RepID=J3PCX4_GAET3|nr:hypothetical protein GGTG_11343 [Gaeumannomyces tritici R3-111a-1]EJT72096.1 hypothetical protein GGTG_11343 [Gaeumannomyces tritici R3-111a-1]
MPPRALPGRHLTEPQNLPRHRLPPQPESPLLNDGAYKSESESGGESAYEFGHESEEESKVASDNPPTNPPAFSGAHWDRPAGRFLKAVGRVCLVVMGLFQTLFWWCAVGSMLLFCFAAWMTFVGGDLMGPTPRNRPASLPVGAEAYCSCPRFPPTYFQRIRFMTYEGDYYMGPCNCDFGRHRR